MAEIRIRVGAAIDASVTTVFPKIEQAANRSAKAIEREQSRSAKQAALAIEQEERRKMLIRERSALMAGQLAARQASSEIREAQRAERERIQSEKRVQREAERDQARAVQERERFQRRLKLGAVGYTVHKAFGAVSFLGRMRSDLMRGAGINALDPGALAASYVSRQKLAQDIANSGYLPGTAGANGVRQNAGDLMTQAGAVGKAAGIDPEKALEGLQKFVAITGDLETGRSVLGDMAKMARATGSNMEDVVTAAGEISAKLGDVPNKSEAINAIMRQIAGAGKLGAVEMRDFAKQLASVAAVAPQFGGDVQKNIGEMGVLLQEARQRGGAKSAPQAATAVTAFANVFTKKARVKAYREATGHDVFDAQGKLISPEQLIMESLRASSDKSGKVDQVKLGGIFGSTQAMRAVRGFQNVYTAAGGGEAGLKAVHEEFERLRKATMSQADVDEAFNKSMETTEGKVARFNALMTETGDKMLASLLPAVVEMAPAALSVVQAFAGLVSGSGDLATAFAHLLGIKTNAEADEEAKQTANAESARGSQGTSDVLTLQNVAREGGHVSKATITRAQLERDALSEQLRAEEEQLAKDEKMRSRSGHLLGRRGLAELDSRIGSERQQIGQDREKYNALAQALKEALHEGAKGRLQIDDARPIKVQIVGGAAPTGSPTPPMPAARP